MFMKFESFHLWKCVRKCRLNIIGYFLSVIFWGAWLFIISNIMYQNTWVVHSACSNSIRLPSYRNCYYISSIMMFRITCNSWYWNSITPFIFACICFSFFVNNSIYQCQSVYIWFEWYQSNEWKYSIERVHHCEKITKIFCDSRI